MLKVGDILWTFCENDYSVGEVSNISVFEIKGDTSYYLVNTNGIIGKNHMMFIPVTEDFNTLVKVQNYLVNTYFTTSEKEAVKFIESHYND